MTKGNNLYITGDTHGDFIRFSSKFFEVPDKSIIIICGDFGGVWNESSTNKYWLDWLGKKPYTFLFVDGNHENYDLLNSYPVSVWNGGKVHAVRENVIHLMRGQIFNIEGVRFFTFGGARSHDIRDGILSTDDPLFAEKKKKLDRERGLYRIEHLSWWKEEMPSEAEKAEGLANLEKAGNAVDVILSHCAPTSIQDVLSRGMFEHDDLTEYLEQIKQRCTFSKWFFGHYHENKMIGRKYILLYEMVAPLEDFFKEDES